MAIIIDTNCLAHVFSRKSQEHDNFKPVLDWILNGKGIIIYGGSKYQNELIKTPKYIPILRFLKEVNKAYVGNKENIDKLQKEIEDKRTDADFDDPHLPAIVIDTKCRLICSKDFRAIPFVTDKKYYPNGFHTPIFYTGLRNREILNDNNIDNRLKPICKLKKAELEKVRAILN
ncbi:hypothetical protein [Roseimarinus sediminis]|uniref:hypothetical protein n=1 Tax=Roseimarinus sediminis TaxID=1610899 RepID=UPI003D2212A1